MMQEDMQGSLLPFLRGRSYTMIQDDKDRRQREEGNGDKSLD